MNRSRYTGSILRHAGAVAGLAAARAIGLALAAFTDPALVPFDQGPPPVAPIRIRLS